MKLAWVNDVHLNFLESTDRQRFYQYIVATKSNAVLVSGDIAEAQRLFLIFLKIWLSILLSHLLGHDRIFMRKDI